MEDDLSRNLVINLIGRGYCYDGNLERKMFFRRPDHTEGFYLEVAGPTKVLAGKYAVHPWYVPSRPLQSRFVTFVDTRMELILNEYSSLETRLAAVTRLMCSVAIS